MRLSSAGYEASQGQQERICIYTGEKVYLDCSSGHAFEFPTSSHSCADLDDVRPKAISTRGVIIMLYDQLGEEGDAGVQSRLMQGCFCSGDVLLL